MSQPVRRLGTAMNAMKAIFCKRCGVGKISKQNGVGHGSVPCRPLFITVYFNVLHAHYKLHTTYFTLDTIPYALQTTHYTLHTTYYHYTLHTTHYTLHR